jgi:predicted alpha/beta superfamily hydrolase
MVQNNSLGKAKMPNPIKNLCRLVFLLISTLAMAGAAGAETVDLVFRVSAPDSAAGLDIYLAGNFQGWDPGDPSYKLSDLGGGQYELTVPLELERILQFKFTRGNWSKVEKGPSGEEIPNRSLRVKQPGTHEFVIADWADKHPTPAVVSTITGQVQSVEIPDFLDGRPVLVYLPPDYEEDATRRYPVLYMFDGQNVFDAATSFAGEWKVDESCEQLIASSRMRPVIVVAVANGGGQRSFEYTPWQNSRFTQGETGGGGQHLQIIVDELVPHIDNNFRTLTGPQNTGLAGSSFGGLMTMYGAGLHRDTFGLFAVLSPSLGWNNWQPIDFAEKTIKPGVRLYVDMGGLEAGMTTDHNHNGVDDNVEGLRKLKRALENNGFDSTVDLMVVEEEKGLHNEASWAKRFPAALVFLFPPEAEDY